MAAKKLD